jgi:hypothetical protein
MTSPFDGLITVGLLDSNIAVKLLESLIAVRRAQWKGEA